MFGDKLNLVSDSLRCAGMPDGNYELGGQPITLKAGKATLQNTDTLAGAAVSVYEGMKNAVRFGLPLEQAVYAAATAPAQAVGLRDTGTVEIGKCADLVVLDQDLNITAVFVDGEKIV